MPVTDERLLLSITSLAFRISIRLLTTSFFPSHSYLLTRWIPVTVLLISHIVRLCDDLDHIV